MSGIGSCRGPRCSALRQGRRWAWFDWAQKIGFIGTAYVTVLKYLALPTLILAVFCAAMKGGRNAASTLFRAVTLFALMFVASFLLCAVPYGLFAPGKSFSMTGESGRSHSKRTGTRRARRFNRRLMCSR